MTGDQSRLLNVGDRVSWHNDQADQGTVTEKNWAGVTEPPRVCRRLFGLSYAAMAACSSMA